MSQVEMDLNVLEKDSRALSGLFQTIVNDMKGSTVIWEDFNSKAAKLHTALRSTIVIIASFLDAFQKVADLANGSRGATRDIGAALTRLCIRHRSIETKLRAFTAAITEAVMEPLQTRLEEWKKTTAQLDKDHAKEYKKVQQEIKKASSDTIRLQKQTKKGQSDLRHRLENAMQDVHAKYVSLEEIEKRAVRCAMIEERSRFCSFISFLTPLMEHEISMLTEVTHLQEIIDVLTVQTADPTTLPQSSEQVILDLKDSDGSQKWSCTPPGSPLSLGSHLGSHRSSTCSINSSSSSSLQSSQGMQQALVTTPQLHLSATPFAPVPSTLSHDSGYASQDFAPVDFGREMAIKLAEEIALNSVPVSTEELVDDGVSPMSNCPLHPVGTTVPPSWPHSPGYFHPSASTPAFFEPSTFYERPHTISYSVEHSHARPALTALTFEPPSNSKSQNASNQSLPSNFGNCAVPSNTGVTMRLPRTAEDGEVVADIYARPSLQGQRRSGVGPCPVAPPTVPAKFYTLQMQQSKTDSPQPIYVNTFSLNSQGKPETNDMNDGKADEQNASSPNQSLFRSFSFPVQSSVLPTSGQNKSCDLPMVDPQDTRSEKGFMLTSETVTDFDESGKSLTLPRMPQFKVPLVPQRYLSTMNRNSGNIGPPTLPKRSSSKLSGKPPPPMRCNSAKSASMERITSAPAAPVVLNTSHFRHSMDTSSIVVTEMRNPSECSNNRILSASNVDANSNGHGANTKPGMSQDTEDDRSKLNAADGSMHSLRQQAPPSDDSDQLRPLPVQPETVIPLFEEVLECSFTQMHSPIRDSIASPVTIMPPELSDDSSEVSAGEDSMLEIIKRGVILRRTITNDRSAPRIVDY